MMKLRGFEELFHKSLLEKGIKFLGVFPTRSLEELEILSGRHLGSKDIHGRKRKSRPFLAVYENHVYKMVFLSTQSYSHVPVSLSSCNNSGKGFCKNIKQDCFAFRDNKEKKVLCYLIREERFGELEKEICGTCKELNIFDGLSEVWLNGKELQGRAS
ncbi:hypothetical protein [Hydrogenobacter thermophilus]|uniref:hypothetical protein n=1 Tax=Hydrogenobacter thermophilus TaxID=940 RepID=UPI0030F746B3